MGEVKESLDFLFHLPLHFLFFERFFLPDQGGGAVDQSIHPCVTVRIVFQFEDFFLHKLKM